MTASATTRAVAWAVAVVGAGLFVLRRNTSSGDAPFAVLLPLLLAWTAVVVLLWVGPFPNSWASVGGVRRGVPFWFALALLCVLCAYMFYGVFRFRT